MKMRYRLFQVFSQCSSIFERVIPYVVVILGLNGLIAYLFKISKLRVLSYLILSSPLPLAYSSPEIASTVTVSIDDQQGLKQTRKVTRNEFAKLAGPLQRRTALIYLFTKSELLGKKIVQPALHYLFCEPGVLLDELELSHHRPLHKLTWNLQYLGFEQRPMKSVSYHCQQQTLSLEFKF